MVKLAMSPGIGRCNQLSLRHRTVEPLVSWLHLSLLDEDHAWCSNKWMHTNFHSVDNVLIWIFGWLVDSCLGSAARQTGDQVAKSRTQSFVRF